MAADQPKTRRPANTAFKQQRLKAWQPILTPKTVLPALIIIGVIFAPLGGLLLWANDTVSELVIDYTNCDKAGAGFVQVPSDAYSANFADSSSDGLTPEYMSRPDVGSGNNATWRTTKCTVKFNIPTTMKKPIFVYYRLTNFYQNHRRFVKSMDSKQLSGAARTAAELKGGSCEPLATITENGVQYPIYPCGLIANSMFNDTFSLFLLPADTETNNNRPFILTDTGIAWKGDTHKYGKQTYPDLSMIRPPPNWKNYPNGYSASSQPPDVSKDSHFQVWMRPAGLPNFRKLYSKNEEDNLLSGNYTIDIDMNYNVTSYGGTKSLVITTVSFMGGRSPFIGIAYIVVGVLCVVLGLLFTARHLYKPRAIGDHTYLTWHQKAEPAAEDELLSSDGGPANGARGASTGVSVRH
ncbi:hypothetical protein BGW38_002467 [Lunasporangiospora selenospora]|uniref:Uncharacterized protein n=1 Tax=Lunasporangiospora selenospora TaxID=979761 RepID=A0A9P6G1B0_9FUNG|nr:hypothetical protein BGW38_002467 [Lunasporangiospora selenospora]